MAISHRVPGNKQLYAQPSSMSCWATVYMMMKVWRTNSLLSSIRAAIVPLGQPWLGYFDRNAGIPPKEGANFERAVGLVREPRMNLTPEGWKTLLQRHGLLWVSGTVPGGGGIHDRILEGIDADSGYEQMSGGVWMEIMDPNGGRRYPEPMEVFLQGYEGQAAIEPFYLDYQILHF